MFDLNEALARWRDSMKASGILGAEILDELESHLLDEMDGLSAQGIEPEQAFTGAMGRLGVGEALRDEFAKLRGEKGGAVGSLGEVLIMGETEPNRFKSRLVTVIFLSFLGFTIFGWACLLVNEDTIMSVVGDVLVLVVALSLVMGLVAAGVRAVCDYRRLQRHAAPLSPRANGLLFGGFMLLPFFAYSVVGLLLTVPFWVKDWTTPESAKAVRHAASPDGQWEALVIDKPGFDGPYHDLYVRRAGDAGKRTRVAMLMGDLDTNQRIAWSPRGDVVVFVNYYDLFAVRMTDFKSAMVPLGGRLVINPKKTIRIDGQPATIGDLQFEPGGGITYKLAGSAETMTIPPEAFQSRPESYKIDPFRR